MSKKRAIFILILFSIVFSLSGLNPLFNQKSTYPRVNLLNQPESVEYYSAENLWLVSNWGSGEIIAIDSLGNQSIFNQDLSSVAGIKIYNNKLYCCNTTGIGIIDLSSRVLDTLIVIEGSDLLNDLVINDGKIYVSDYWDPKIYIIYMEDYSYDILVQEPNFVPNGLYFEEENNRIMAVVRNENGTQPRVMAINPENGELTLVKNTPYYSLDGIYRDCEGNYYITSWLISTGVEGVIKYNSDFSDAGEIITTNCSGPADIFIYESILAIPNLNSNTLDLVDLNITGNEDEVKPPLVRLNQNYPNPFNPETTICFNLQKKCKVDLSVYNIKGERVQNLIHQEYSQGEHKITFNANHLSSGVYFYKLQTGNLVQTRKMLLIK